MPKSNADKKASKAVNTFIDDIQERKFGSKRKKAMIAFEKYYFEKTPDLGDKLIKKLLKGGGDDSPLGLCTLCGQTKVKTGQLLQHNGNVKQFRGSSNQAMNLLAKLLDEKENEHADEFKAVLKKLPKSIKDKMKLKKHHTFNKHGNMSAAIKIQFALTGKMKELTGMMNELGTGMPSGSGGGPEDDSDSDSDSDSDDSGPGGGGGGPPMGPGPPMGGPDSSDDSSDEGPGGAPPSGPPGGGPSDDSSDDEGPGGAGPPMPGGMDSSDDEGPSGAPSGPPGGGPSDDSSDEGGGPGGAGPPMPGGGDSSDDDDSSNDQGPSGPSGPPAGPDSDSDSDSD